MHTYDTDILINQGIKQLNAKNNNEALSIFDQAILLNSNLHSLKYGRAIALARMGCVDNAIETLNQLIINSPNHQKAKLLLDELSPRSRQNVNSANLITEKGTNKQAFDIINVPAFLINDKKSIKQAFELLNNAKSINKPIQGVDFLRAKCFLEMNQHDSARESLREELRYFPNNLEARNLLNDVLKKHPQIFSGTIDDTEFLGLLQVIQPYTMLSEERLFSLFSLTKKICIQNIPGNFVECGVAAGGSTALLAYVIKHYSNQPRWLYAFDSFEGMPVPTKYDTHNSLAADLTGWGTGTCASTEKIVMENCDKLGVSDIVKTVKGYFANTLPVMKDRVGMISFLHLDGDWYESTKAILVNLYDRVINNGILQVDDYGYWAGCKKGLHEFEAERKTQFKLNNIDSTGVWFSKPDMFPVNPDIPEAFVKHFNEDDPVSIGIESQMSPNERFQLYYIVCQLLSLSSFPLKFIEIGTFAGASLMVIYNALKRMGHPFKGVSIEPGKHPQLIKILKILEEKVTHLQLLSNFAVPEVTALFENDINLPDFIFVDGDHTYKGVRQDILNYFPLLAPGGIMLFHDYLPPLNDKNLDAILFHHAGQEPGVRQACHELMEVKYSCDIIDLPLLYPTDPTQTQPHLPIIPGVYSTLRAYRKSNHYQE